MIIIHMKYTYNRQIAGTKVLWRKPNHGLNQIYSMNSNKERLSILKASPCLLNKDFSKWFLKPLLEHSKSSNILLYASSKYSKTSITRPFLTPSLLSWLQISHGTLEAFPLFAEAPKGVQIRTKGVRRCADSFPCFHGQHHSIRDQTLLMSE